MSSPGWLRPRCDWYSATDVSGGVVEKKCPAWAAYELELLAGQPQGTCRKHLAEMVERMMEGSMLDLVVRPVLGPNQGR